MKMLKAVYYTVKGIIMATVAGGIIILLTCNKDIYNKALKECMENLSK